MNYLLIRLLDVLVVNIVNVSYRILNKLENFRDKCIGEFVKPKLKNYKWVSYKPCYSFIEKGICTKDWKKIVLELEKCSTEGEISFREASKTVLDDREGVFFIGFASEKDMNNFIYKYGLEVTPVD